MSLQMKADISTCQSHKPSAVIWAITRESQRANHAIMKIRTTHTISYDSQGFIRWELEEKEGGIQANLAQKNCKHKITLQIHCNFCKPVNFLSPPCNFFQFEFSRKISHLYLLSVLKSLLSFYKRDNPNSLWCETDHSINHIGKSPPQVGAFVKIRVSTLKISSLIIFLKKSLLNQWWPQENESSTVRYPKAKSSQPLEAQPLLQPTINRIPKALALQTARAFRWCLTVTSTRKLTHSDAPRDERAMKEQ